MADQPPQPAPIGGGGQPGDAPQTQAQNDRAAIDAGGSTGDPQEDARRRIQAQNDDAAAQKAAEDKAAAAQAAAAQAAAAAKAKADYDQAQSHFEYGGWAGGASEAASRYAGLGAAAQGRQGEKLALGAVNDDRNANAEARGQSESMAQLLADRANGKMPLISGMRANQDINRAIADQSSIASTARGPAALALAQQNQANNSASAVSNISSNAQIAGAQEQLANTQAAGNAFNTIRGGDQNLMGADAGISVAQANLNANQRAENDKYQLGMTGYETGVQQAQLGAQGNQVGIAAGQTTAANALNEKSSEFNRSNAAQYIAPAIGAGAAVGGAVLLGALGGSGGKDPSGSVAGGNAGGTQAGASVADPSGAYNAGSAISNGPGSSSSDGGPWPPGRADGGPVEAGKPYLVGERGPELIVPPRDGHVLTAEQTRAAAPQSRVDAFLDGIHPLSYHYKQPDLEPRSQPTGGRYLGISAQDLEAVPEVGHQLVSDGPRGKRVEIGPSLSAALAGIARLHERVKAVEDGDHSKHITSDMAAKTDVRSEGDPRAAVWDQGRSAALANFVHDAGKSPEELRNATGPESLAVRTIKADAYDEGHADGHAAGRGTLLRDQYLAAGRSMDAANAEHAAHRKAPEPFDDSLSRYNPVEGVRTFLRDKSAPAAPARPQAHGAPIAHEAPPTGSFADQLRDRFGAPPRPNAGRVASNDEAPSIASLYSGGR